MCGLQSGLSFMRLFLFLCILFLAPKSFAYSTLFCSTSLGNYSGPSLKAACTSWCCANPGTSCSSCTLGTPYSNGLAANCSNAFGSDPVTCSPATCSPASGEIVDRSIPSGSGYCDPATDCQTVSYDVLVNGVLHNGGSATNGLGCYPPTANTSSVPSNTSCPSGYSLVSGTNGCECVDGSSYTSSSTASTNSSCTGGSATAPTFSPVSPVASTSSSPASCPSGSFSTSSGSSLSCYVLVTPPGSAPSSTSSSSTGTSSSPSSSTSSSPSSPTSSTSTSSSFVAPTISFGSTGLSSALSSIHSSIPFSSIGFGSSWLPQDCIPAPTWNVQLPFGFDKSFTLPTDDLCTLASDLRPFVLAGGVILALMILAW